MTHEQCKELLNNQEEYIKTLQAKLEIYEKGSKASNLLLGYVVNEFDKKNQEYNDKMEDWKNANTYLMAEHRSLMEKYDNLKNNYSELQDEYAALEDGFNDLDEELEKVLNELNDLKLENEDLRRKNYTLHVDSTAPQKEELRRMWAYQTPWGITFKVK